MKPIIDKDKIDSVGSRLSEIIGRLVEQDKNSPVPRQLDFGAYQDSPYRNYPYGSAGDNLVYPFQAFGGISDRDISNILASLTTQSGNLNEDLAAQYADKFLQWLMDLNQRDYDRFITNDDRAYQQSLIDDQRSYDSPSSQLSRLMATGLSRGAALEFLNGGAAPADPIPSTQGSISSPPIHSDMVGAAQRNGQLISSIAMQLVGFGFGAIGAQATRSLASAQAVAQQQANAAQQKSAQLNQHIYNAHRSGLINLDGKSFDSVIDSMSAIPASSSQEIYDFMHDTNGMAALMGTPGAYKISSDNFNTRFGNVDATNVSRQLQYQADAAALQPQQIQIDILKSQAEIDKIYTDIDFENLEIDFNKESFDSRLDLLGSQVENVKSNTRLSNANSSVAEIQAKQSAIALKRMQLTAADMDATAMLRVARELQIAQTLGSSEAMDIFCDTILKDQQAQNSLAVFNCLRLNNLNSLVENNPALLDLHNLCDELDLGGIFYDYLKRSPMYKGQVGKYTDFINSFGRKYVPYGTNVTSSPVMSIMGL